MIRALVLATLLASTATAQTAVEWRAQGKDIVASGLPADGRLAMRLIGPGRSVAQLDDWLVRYADRDASTVGNVVAKNQPAPAGVARMVLREIEDGQGRAAVAYIGRLLPGGTAIGCRVIVGGAGLAAHAKAGMTRCLQSLDALATKPTLAGSTTVAAGPVTPLSEAAIAEVLFVFEMPTFDPTSGTLKGNDDTYLLLRDGRFYYNFNRAPANFDIAALRRENPRRWGRWQRNGKIVQLAWDDGRKSTLETEGGTYVKPCRPARAGETLAQTFSMQSGSTTGAIGARTIVSTSRNLIFRPDGTFGSRGGTVGLTLSTTTGTSSGGVGRYRLSGYTLALTNADGSGEQRMYCRVEAGSVVINGVHYFERD